MSAQPKPIPTAAPLTRDERATWREIDTTVSRLRDALEASSCAPVAPLPGVETIVSRVLVRPRLLDGHTLAEFIDKNRDHLQAYYDAQCALADEDETLPSFREWANCQFDLAVEFRARLADESRERDYGRASVRT